MLSKILLHSLLLFLRDDFNIPIVNCNWRNMHNVIKIILHSLLLFLRDDFNIPIVNFPFICSNIPTLPGYGVYIFQLIRYSRSCVSYKDFLDRRLLLARKLLNQGFLLVKLKSSLLKFYGRHRNLVDCYEIYVSQMTTDMFHLS